MFRKRNVHLLSFILTSVFILDSLRRSTWTKQPKNYPDFGAASSKHIFFIESSGNRYLNSRQACAIESAAKHHANLNIIVYTTNSSGFFKNDSYVTIINNLINVRIRKVDIKTVVKGTPIENWVTGKFWRKSRHLIEHLSDIIRYVILWQQGGIYLDLDNIVLRDMSNLANCAARDDQTHVTGSVLIFSLRNKIISECLRLLPKKWTGNVFGEIGPNLITDVFKSVCGTNDFNEMSRKRCEGSKVMISKSFFIVPWARWAHLFNRNFTESLLEEIIENHSYSVHFYNKLSKNTKVKFNSFSLIEVLAKSNCPLVYKEAKRQGKF